MKMTKPMLVWGWLTFGFVLLAITSWLAYEGVLIFGEGGLLTAIYGLPDSLRTLFLAVALLGSPWILGVILVGLFINDRIDIAARVAAAGFMSLALVAIIKELVARPRPAFLTELSSRELLVFGYGFPSAHVALATAIGLTLAMYIPKRFRYLIGIWILAVAISRMYLGVHAPLDLIGGFATGLVVAICIQIVMPLHRGETKKRIAKRRPRT